MWILVKNGKVAAARLKEPMDPKDDASDMEIKNLRRDTPGTWINWMKTRKIKV